jgi:diguanylate cyclase (GGDEF)-like protein
VDRPITGGMDARRTFTPAVALLSVLALAAVPTGHWNVAWTAAALAALGGMLAARHAAPADERARWTWWSAAAGAWLIGQLAWDWFSAYGAPQSPNLADAGWFSFALLVMGGLVGARNTSRTLRLLGVAEALPLIVAVTALTFSEIWPSALSSSLSPTGVASALAYPGLYVTAAVLTLQAMIAGALHGIRGGGVRLVLAGIAAQAIAFIWWSRQLLDGTYVPGKTLIDPLWVVGMVAIAAGGLVAARAGWASHSRARETEPGDRGGIIPAVTFLILLAAQLRAGFVDPPLGAKLALAVGLATSGATLIARSALLSRRRRTLLESEREARSELARANERLSQDSRRDALTGLRNRRALAEDLPTLESGRYAVALLDVDHFKAYNDRLGHLAGDNALRALAALVRDQLRDGDLAYRYGGEELLIILHDGHLEIARRVAERVRTAVTGAAIPHPGGIGGIVTVSIGLAAGAGDAGRMLARADAALYEAKRSGRNRVLGSPGERSDAPEPKPARLRTALERPVLEAFADLVRSELRYATAVVDVRRGDDTFETVVVLGDDESRRGHVSTWEPGEPLDAPRHERSGALLLPLRDPQAELLGVLTLDAPLRGERPTDEELGALMAVADHAGLVLSLGV